MELNHLSETAREILRKSGAYQEGHFRLTSGLHSGGYLQCALILQYPKYTELIASDLAERIAPQKPDVVFTPAIGGIVFGYELARALKCRAIFAERINGEMCLRRGFRIEENERVLVAEDVVTTGGSVLELSEMVKRAGGKVIGFTAICDRRAGKFKPPEGLNPWITLNIETYDPQSCPLCAKGIPIQKPGSRWK